ncbi:Tm-1-like ATP-binding domain-containing protein [Lacrimispora sp. 210928-DFI.3.58]|uniref:Tm-1-like ATP-binding domain-containing protein n=1 Tax=Lacrimispora sp. 210928-DFI.3.58 TaxID=2883214 RepID=UPI001D08DF2C|nr:Tm-1-like ATP-binding domain-containing protein [Lacrimispora sp. 210928-DFI.3.58]MCB7318688.1 Tm-1-like ATP-binding domain-containing protein [Lacrimispora sp. 210928-DFI.3.58]
MKSNVYFIATYDTKGVESDYIKRQIEKNGANCITVDVGVGGEPTAVPDISLADLCRGSGFTVSQIHEMPRGRAVETASNLVEKYVGEKFKNGEVDSIIGIGGAGGTQIVTQTMRTLPLGLPKLMLSTLAAGNVRWYLEDSDIAMMPSMADVAGLNCVTTMIFDRFAALAAKSAQWYKECFPEHKERLADCSVHRVSQTMYGTTTKGVTKARNCLEKMGYETLVFHASGAGGRAMENLIRGGVIHGVLDMTLAEIGAHLVGGLHNAGPRRLEAAVEKKIPQVIVPGGADTIVLPPMADLPDKFKNGRILNYHNPTMTTMRTNVEENERIGQFIVEKLKKAETPVVILIPKGGLSSIDKPGDIFYLPEANEMLFHTLKEGLKGTKVTVIEDERHLYDPGFGERAAEILDELMKKHYGK